MRGICSNYVNVGNGMASSAGRPALQIDIKEVEQLRKIGISMTKISEVMGISRSTLYRALENTDLIGYTDINDQELR